MRLLKHKGINMVNTKIIGFNFIFVMKLVMVSCYLKLKKGKKKKVDK